MNHCRESLSTLNKQLNIAQDSWKLKQKLQTIQNKKAEHESKGKTCIDWNITIPEGIRYPISGSLMKPFLNSSSLTIGIVLRPLL